MSFTKLTYDVKKWYDCPIMTQRPNTTAEDYRTDNKLEKQKWGKLVNTVYFYIAINPEKSQPVLQVKTDEELKV